MVKGPPCQQVPSRVDFAVVGGGLAGLSAALALADAEPGASIAVLEAEVVGFGASGRNGGLLSPLPAPVWLLTASHNPEHAWALKHINGRVHALAARLATESPGSGITPAVLRMQAQGRLTATGLSRVGRTIEGAGIAVSDGIGPGRHLALELQTHTLDPYRTVLALAAQARARGIEIHEHTPVRSIEEEGDGVRVTLNDGRALASRRAILSTNGYSTSIALPGKIPAKVVWNFMVAAPLTDLSNLPSGKDNPAADGKSSRFVVELNTSYVFYRVHNGHVVFGGIERFKPYGDDDFAVPPDVLAGLESLLARSFPSAALTPTETWGGRYHQTNNDLPLLSCMGEHGRIVLNAGYGGTGVSMTMICAPLAAALARDGKFLTDDDRRLFRAIKATPLPVAGIARFVALVGGDVILQRGYEPRT
jgi:glycine/D-amino acid oxidase-like deaminating enzyme